jgi:uncharacterized protein (TIGR02268 family)
MLGGTLAAAQAPSSANGPRQVRRIELAPVPLHAPPEIAIRPGTASLLLFDTPIVRDGVELEERERFSRVATGDDTLALLPSEALREGERLRLTVRFADGAAPAEARFLLVVVLGQADAQVEVLRSRRAAEPGPLEPAGLTEELQRLREENARLRAERGPGGLTGAITEPWSGGKGITVARLGLSGFRGPGAGLKVTAATCFRATTRLAVDMLVTHSPGEPPWSPGGAVLRDTEGRRLPIIQLWQPGSTTGSALEVHVIVEAELSESAGPGPYTLELPEAGGDRTFTHGSLMCPAP